MNKPTFATIIFIFFALISFAQPVSREALEKQRSQLRKEIEQTEKLLNSNRAKTKENLLQYKLISNKVNLQDRVIGTINRDLNMLNNNIFTIQKDIRKYDRVLDTLKREYAKSMVYAYKNRSNYEFVNFIFSAESFNDAIKRITYLKSYRNYREIQGENILRTQELRRKRAEELGATKQSKNQALQVQSKELQTLAQQQKEKDRILAELKKQGKTLNKEIAAKQRQMQKVNNAIASAIKRALEEARKEALAKAAAEAKKKLAEENANPTVAKTPIKKVVVPKPGTSELLNAENIALNSSFERNKGSLPWPVDRGTVIMHYGTNTLPSGTKIVVASVTIAADLGTPVKSVFDGTISAVTAVEDMQVITIQHGRYFSTYSNLSSVNVSKGQEVKTGQVIGRVGSNFDGIPAIDFYMSNEKSNYDPESWLRRR
jgi:septal ring factor EnvC (AmiA/AmiB activator)